MIHSTGKRISRTNSNLVMATPLRLSDPGTTQDQPDKQLQFWAAFDGFTTRMGHQTGISCNPRLQWCAPNRTMNNYPVH
uniref:Uncharacterized protein n=1 Tax=Ralstonia solanacearum TaxID=305 RepID=A0A0S4U026_RALSL|nr:protein of unknown function [Ralstonia solanacearum]